MDLTKDNFDQVVNESEGLVLVDFWAPWCGPCKMMGPIIDEISGEIDGVTFAKVNVDENGEVAMQYNVMSIPTFILFKGGQVIDQFVGAMSKDSLKERLEKHL